MKVSYCSLGCKVNEYEAVAIINDFIDHGFEVVKFNEKADVYIINTCTVTASSDSKSRKMIRQAVNRNPQAVVAVMGCFAQLNSEIVNQIQGVDIVIGTSNRDQLFKLVEAVLKNKQPQFLIDEILQIREYEEIKLKRFLNHTRGFIKIEDGCNNFCSYCRIPFARGQVRSRKANDVIEEIQNFVDQGMKEIVLTGINTGAYGIDLLDYSFAELLTEIVNNTLNLGRIRISSIEATEITDQLLDVIKANEKHFCDHFHIPLQAGSNGILQKMNRKYTKEFYAEKISKIRKLFPECNITTDYLAGFPGETLSDFEEGLEFVKSMNFGEMHIFPFSKRPNTEAYYFTNTVDEQTKKARVNELLALNKEKSLAYRKKFEGQLLAVVVEKNINNIAIGHSSNYMQVKFNSKAKSNDLCYVQIVKAGYPVSIGKEIKNV